MRYFYDTEFIEDGRTIDLISIGMVAEDGREYYAVNSEAPWDRVKGNDWLVRNVLPSLPVVGERALATYVASHPHHFPRPPVDLVDVDRSDARVKPHWVIRNEVRDFLLSDGEPELWAWYGAYDHVALAQLWGPMIALPDGVPMWTHDLNQQMERYPDKLAGAPQQMDGAHNALADARHVRALYEYLTQEETHAPSTEK